MEHQTINAYGNGYKKAPEGFDWLFQHEFSHEWFGNQVTAANWDDYWIHEGYGEYMQPAYGLWREGYARYATMMDEQRNKILNAVPITRGRWITEEEVYEPTKGGPGGDIYYKGAWMLHTLRWLIGDKQFWDVTRLEVYGRPDPKPGNFTPRFGSTRDYEDNVKKVTGKDYDWFFDVYLRKADLPELVEARSGNHLNLFWLTPDKLAFPMPIEVLVDDRLMKVDMPDGTATIDVPADAHVVVDPYARVLKRSRAVEDYQAGLRRKR
jgi:aminopeptidase N